MLTSSSPRWNSSRRHPHRNSKRSDFVAYSPASLEICNGQEQAVVSLLPFCLLSKKMHKLALNLVTFSCLAKPLLPDS